MCGIVGALGNYGRSDNAAALHSIRHRGPDDTGILNDDNIFLGHVRLSILDTSTLGHQPMVSDDGRYTLIFNGEIYNHLDFRHELQEAGHTFVSASSDTETLLAGLAHWGADFVRQLNGIFAFAFYDRVEKMVLLARDHFGVKPLYYYASPDGFIFSSEAKAILDFGIEPLTVDAKHLMDYVSFLWSPGEGTPVRQIKKVLPGHYAILRQDGRSVEWVKYYTIPYTGSYVHSNEKETVDLLDAKLRQAVRRQLLSDVPVGFFLSGGLDSSLLVAMARQFSHDKLQCFTIETDVDHATEGFENDLTYARKAASHLQVDLEVVQADFDIVRDFDKMVWHLDEPQSDAAPLNVLNISARARSMGIKVLIGGTAGDDLFSGYRRHLALQGEGYWKYIPAPIIKVLSRLPLDQRVAFFRRVKKILGQLDKPIEERLANYYSWIAPDRARALFSLECREEIGQYHPTQKLLSMVGDIPNEKSWLNRMLYWEKRSFLVDHNLNYTDKMGMAAGVEIRVPYLDVELVEFACSIDPGLKMKKGETKYILKKVAERYLPKEIIYRSKTGFGAPVRKWILEDMEELIKTRLSKENLKHRGIFDPDEVWQLMEDNRIGKIDASYSVWSLLAIDSWMSQFMTCEKVGAKA